MRVFLTGGTGFVGLAMIARFLEQGAEVMATAEAPPPDWAVRALGDGVRFGVVDVRDRAGFGDAMAEWRPDILVHGAALTPDEARERAGGAADIFEINVAGTATAIELAATLGVPRVMAFSSGAAYGRTLADTDVLDEVETECRPATLYAISKLAAERVALRLGDLHGVSVVTPRLSAAWGPWEYATTHRQTPSPGWHITDAISAGERPTVPAGAALPLVFSEDAADMLVRLCFSDQAQGVFNVGSAEMVDLQDLADAAATAKGISPDATERPVPLFVAGRPPMQLDRLTGAIGPLRKTPVLEALQRTLDWLAGVAE
ncbi:MAG: NAD(P)-dependent oxidoreductase [Pseudomonadota bacterium]